MGGPRVMKPTRNDRIEALEDLYEVVKNEHKLRKRINRGDQNLYDKVVQWEEVKKRILKRLQRMSGE